MNYTAENVTEIQGNVLFDVPSSAYIHIPFCRRRCYYCDFPISVVGDNARGETSGTIEQYVDILCQEIAVTPKLDQTLTTVFFGGGTPSLLSEVQLGRILSTLDQRFGLQAGAEVSMEVDPGTFTLEQLQGYQAAGVNRVSIGAQAFQSELLQACGRSHTVAEIYEAVEIVCQTGLTNFNLDLISGLPNQTLDQWQASLEATVALAPTHVSTYDLTIEPGTAFGRQYQPGNKPLPTEETTVQMYQLAGQVLQASGYEHYEISNYARPGYQCCHNRVYWQNRPYYGFGMGATSYIQAQRFTRPRNRQAYFQWVENLIGSAGAIASPRSTTTEVLLETLMLGLRLAEGLDVETLARQFGKKAVEQIFSCLTPYLQKGWVELVKPYPLQTRIRLSDPEGFLFSNVVLVALWTELEEIS